MFAYFPDRDASGLTVGNRTATFQFIEGVKVLGGYEGRPGTDPDDPDVPFGPVGRRDPAIWISLLSGEIGSSAVVTDNSYHVVSADSLVSPAAVLEGFSIRGGRADCSGCQGGGGIFILGGNPAIASCVIEGNTGPQGGSVYIDSPGKAITLTDVTIQGTASAGRGGGLYCVASTLTIDGGKISGAVTATAPETFARGGGLYAKANSVTLDQVLISNSTASGSVPGLGGGAYLETPLESGVVTLTSTSFKDNSASAAAGAIRATGKTVTLRGGWVDRNTAAEVGAGWITVPNTGQINMVYMAVADNRALSVAPGGFLLEGGTQKIHLSQFQRNLAPGAGGLSLELLLAQRAEVVNSEFVGRRGSADGSALLLVDLVGQALVTNSTFTGGSSLPGTGRAILWDSSQLTVLHSILVDFLDTAGNPLAPILPAISPAQVLFSDVVPAWTGSGVSNLSVNPQFDPADLYRPLPASPVVQRISPSSLPADEFDLDRNSATTQIPLDASGLRRIACTDVSPLADWGAYEAITKPACKADWNLNCVVDIADLSSYQSSFFAGERRADLNGDRAVTTEDLFIHLDLWFDGCP